MIVIPYFEVHITAAIFHLPVTHQRTLSIGRGLFVSASRTVLITYGSIHSVLPRLPLPLRTNWVFIYSPNQVCGMRLVRVLRWNGCFMKRRTEWSRLMVITHHSFSFRRATNPKVIGKNRYRNGLNIIEERIHADFPPPGLDTLSVKYPTSQRELTISPSNVLDQRCCVARVPGLVKTMGTRCVT